MFDACNIFDHHDESLHWTHPTEYQIGNKCCPMCAAGSRVETDCSEFRTTSCLPCLDGTFRNKPTGRKECVPCISCDEGISMNTLTDLQLCSSTYNKLMLCILTPSTRTSMNFFSSQSNSSWSVGSDHTGLGLNVKTSCTTISKAVCEPLEGFYCIDPLGNNCVAAQKHRICHPGQYIKQKGTASTDTVCSDCSTGTFSDGTFTSCHPHTQCESVNLQLIKPGTASTDAECGEKRSNVGTAVTITCVLILLMFAGIVVFFFREESEEEESLEPIPRPQATAALGQTDGSVAANPCQTALPTTPIIHLHPYTSVSSTGGKVG